MSKERLDFRVYGFPAYGPPTVAIVTKNPDTRRSLAVSVPVTWEVEGGDQWEDADEPEPLRLVARVDMLAIADAVNAEARRLAGDGPAPETPPPVSNAGLRAMFQRRAEAGEDNPAALARKLGWTCMKDGKESPDRNKVLDMLGIARARELIPYETAVQICTAMQCDPVEVGL